ncbi:hypothetical protein [Nocardia miyunensis]|uniref:hypothetical protein n=1 Tax=Nocardia miyunensis TaxID=282684 RepID=UPI000AF84453|nr:hypothetical protein [Nocardia miyunensis]
MANPYQPGPAPMPSPPPQGYGWPAQPGMPVVQPNSPYPGARPAAPRSVPLTVAAGLTLLAVVVGVVRTFVYEGDADWIADWYVLTWIILLGTAVYGVVSTLMNRNPTMSRVTVALASGMAFIGPFNVLTSGIPNISNYPKYAYNFWLSIPSVLLALAAIVLLYIASRSNTSHSPARPCTPAPPGWPQQPRPVPAQAPQWPQPVAQNLQPPTGFHAPQPPAGYAPQPVYQPAGYPQPGFAPQPPPQQPSAPQQPVYPSPPPQQPPYGAPQLSAADPTILRQPPAPAEGQRPIPQPPNAFGQTQDSGAQPTVLQRPGGFGTPLSAETPSTASQQPDTAKPSTAPQPSSAPDAPSTSQPSVQAGPAQPVPPQPGTSPSGAQQPPSAQQ